MSAVVLLAIFITGAAFVLGINVTSPEQFLDAQNWTQAASACLRSF